MINRAAFFDAIRAGLFGGRLNQAQVEGISIILDGWRTHGSGEDKQLAYVLATSLHETGHTMQPIPERGQRSYFDKYEPGTRIGRTLGNTVAGDGYRFRGRGFVQITGRANFARMGKRLGIDLVGNPDWALKPEIAVQTLVIGMTEGLFTGKSLSDYIGRTRCDYRNARRIVNGVDKAALIAGYAERFQEAIELADIPGPPDVAPIPDPDIDMRPLPDGEGGANIGAIVGALIAAAITAAAIFLGVK